MVTFEHFSRLVHEIYDTVLDSTHWAAALQEISSALGATGCAVLTTDPGHNEISVKSSGADPASVTTYNEYFCHLDPSPSALGRMPTGLVVPNEQLVDRDLLTHSEFFHDWANPYEYGDGAYAVLTRGENGTSWMCAAAEAKPEPFGTSERVSLLQAVVPHMQHAIKLHARLSELDRRSHDLVAALDKLADGIAIVGRDGRVIHLNAAAEAIVARRDGLCVCSGYLRATITHIDGMLDRMMHQALAKDESDPASAGCVAVPRSDGRRDYVLRSIPIGVGGVADAPPHTAVIIIVDPESEPVPDSDALRRLYGLTKTEAEVALRVLDGTGLVPIAEELAMSLATVRTHLQHVFDKTDTHRQAELVRLLLRGAPATRRV
jgi:DNA-binding CsgD family transcriptional regulator